MPDMMKKILSAALAVSLSSFSFSCKSLDPKLLEQTATFDKSVVPMRVVINTDSIKACFPGGWRADDSMDSRRELYEKWKKGSRKELPGVESMNYWCCSISEQELVVKLIKNNLLFVDRGGAYLSVVVRGSEWTNNMAWGYSMFITAGIFLLLGWPASSQRVSLDLEAAVMRRDGRILKTYKTAAVETEYIAMFWGYERAYKTAYIKALIAGCADLRKQIEADRENINKLIR